MSSPDRRGSALKGLGRSERRHDSHYVRRRTDTAVIEASTILRLGGSGCAGV